MKIWVHTRVRNEDKFIWFALASIVRHVEKILVWDTGSSDLTPKVVFAAQKYFPGKIDYKEVGEVPEKRILSVREEMLRATDADWVINLDGDEVWWDDSIAKLVELIQNKGNHLESIFVRTINPVGDIYHYQPEDAGFYEIGGIKGHLNLRAFSTKIPGLHLEGTSYPGEAYCDGEGTPIQNRSPYFLDVPYLHLSHLIRSSSKEVVLARGYKFKYEVGHEFPSDYLYPEVFFRPRPAFVSSPWIRYKNAYFVRALFETPLKRFIRKLRT